MWPLVFALLVLLGAYIAGMTLVRRKNQREMETWLSPERRRWRDFDDEE
jgi:hypothetical protein